MKKHPALRVCSLFLASVLACLFLLTACGSETQEQSSTPQTESQSSTDDPGYDPIYQDADGNYVAKTSGKTYEGKTVTFLTTNVNPTYNSEILKNDPSSPYYAANEALPDVINNALGQRIALVEERLGLTIEEEFLHDPHRLNGKFIERVRMDAINLMPTYQIITPCFYDAATMAQEGLLLNLFSLPGIQMQAPWWDQVFNEEMTIAGQLYFAIGDIGINSKANSAALLFNKQMYTDLGLTEKYNGTPYDLVRSGKWTLDVVLALTREVSEDITPDGTIDYKDRYGWGGQEGDMHCLFYASSAKLASTKTADGYPMLTAFSERNSRVVEKIQNLMQDDRHYVSADDFFGVVQWPSVLLENNFIAGNSLFFSGNLNTPIELGEMSDPFGMVPSPKGDEEQAEYRSLVSPWGSSCFAVPKTLPDEDKEMIADLLNEMGAVSANIVSRAYVEQCVEYMKTRDEETIEMIEQYILPGRGCDIGLIYGWGNIGTMLRNMCNSPVGTYSSAYQEIEGAAQAALNETINFFKNPKDY